MFKWVTAGTIAGMVTVGSFFMVDTTISAQAEDGSPAIVQEEHRRGGPGRMQARGAHKAVAAEVLGLTEEELMDAREAGQTLEEIIAAQGLTMEDFLAAMQTARIAQINQAVADGEMTQEQADAIIERIEDGNGRPTGHRGSDRSGDRSGDRDGNRENRGNGPVGRGGPGSGHHAEILTDVLGLTVEELQAAYEAGQTMDEIVDAQGLTMEEFQAAVQAARIAQINQAVADGELTQEQADRMIERIENSEGREGRPGRQGGRRGGPRGEGHGQRR